MTGKGWLWDACSWFVAIANQDEVPQREGDVLEVRGGHTWVRTDLAGMVAAVHGLHGYVRGFIAGAAVSIAGCAALVWWL